MKKISLLFLLVSFLTVTTADAGSHRYKKNLRYKFLKNCPVDTTTDGSGGDTTTNNNMTVNISGAIGAGADMWTAAIANLFAPHEDNCDSLTETFVQVTSDAKGFCIEIDERPAQGWEVARHMCVQDGKRLPEIAELKYVCANSAELGITIVGSVPEWSSNFVLVSSEAAESGKVTVAAMGSGNCNNIKAGRVAKDDFGGNPESFPFRCVR